MTLAYTCIERMKTSLIFFFRGLVYLAAHWAIGIFLTCFCCIVVGAAGRVYDFDLYWEHSGRWKKINVTLYIHTENVLR